MEHETGLCLNTTKLLEFHKQHSMGPSSTVVDTIYNEKLHSLTVKKIRFGVNFCSYLIGSFWNKL